MNRKKEESTKITLPMNDQLIQKAKACQEMIMYEKVDGVSMSQSQLISEYEEVRSKFTKFIDMTISE